MRGPNPEEVDRLMWGPIISDHPPEAPDAYLADDTGWEDPFRPAGAPDPEEDEG